MKKTILLLTLSSLFLLTACSDSNQGNVITSTDNVITSISDSLNITTLDYTTFEYESKRTDAIYFKDGDDIMITESGSYEFSGNYTTSTITVNVDKAVDKGIVYLIFDGVNIDSDSETPVNIIEAKNVVILLADGSSNTITQGNIVTSDTEFPSGAIYSKSDTVISGSGTLNIVTEYQDGINVRDDLIIDCASITVTAAEDGIVGKDLLQISDSIINIDCGKDGLKSSNDEDATIGNVLISSGIFTINSAGDSISSDNNMRIDDGEFTLISGGGFTGTISNSSLNAQNRNNKNNAETTITIEEDTPSTKSIKAANDIVINGGTFYISSLDDTIHSNNSVVINGGTYELMSNDDAIHAELYLQINGGTINISDCYEGLEGGLAVEINDGNINIISSDDCMNASDTQSGKLIINGGTIKIYYYGNDSDGFDSNNDFIQTGGNIIIDKTNTGTNTQGALDVDGNFYQTGGTIVDANGNTVDLSTFTGNNSKPGKDNKR